jgi:peptidoglycan/xylan/chitin deacetylase (PgdA/CDA1 family)
MIRLAFRFDDPSRSSDHALERAILACFRAASVPLTAAVIPFECGGDTPRELTAEAVPHLVEAQREGVLEIALHGYCHRCLARLPDGNSTEFAGIGAERQRAFLTEGKACLEGVFGTRVNGFVPPWNSYDATTLDLLAELGFAYLSADWALVREDDLPLPVLPHTCNLAHLRGAVSEARQFASLDPVIVVILHHFDFAESGSSEASTDIQRTAELLSWVRGAPDLACTGLEALAARLQPAQCRRNLRLARWRKGLHWRLQRRIPHYSLLGGEAPGFTYGIARRAVLGLPPGAGA